MTETPRETREKLIIQWYEKKLNRDELLRVLEWSEILDKKGREKIKSEIIKNFYENFERAKGDEGFKSADAEYRDIKKTKRNLEEKSAELIQKKEESEDEFQEIDSQMLDIAEMAMELENWSRWKKWKLKNTNKKRDELEDQQRKLRQEIWKLREEKADLQSSLKEKEEKYWLKKKRTINKSKKIELVWTVKKVLKSQTTLEWYREKYFKIIHDREEYMKNLLSEIKNMDLWISEEKKEEVMEQIKVNMQQEIDSMKWWDEILKLADETEKWLEDNWEIVMKKLLDLKWKISEKENDIEKIESKEKWAKTDEILQIREKQFELKKELLELKNEYETVKWEIDEKLKQYEGKGIDFSKELRVESWKKRQEETKRMKKKTFKKV